MCVCVCVCVCLCVRLFVAFGDNLLFFCLWHTHKNIKKRNKNTHTQKYKRNKINKKQKKVSEFEQTSSELQHESEKSNPGSPISDTMQQQMEKEMKSQKNDQKNNQKNKKIKKDPKYKQNKNENKKNKLKNNDNNDEKKKEWKGDRTVYDALRRTTVCTYVAIGSTFFMMVAGYFMGSTSMFIALDTAINSYVKLLSMHMCLLVCLFICLFVC